MWLQRGRSSFPYMKNCRVLVPPAPWSREYRASPSGRFAILKITDLTSTLICRCMGRTSSVSLLNRSLISGIESHSANTSAAVVIKVSGPIKRAQSRPRKSDFTSPSSVFPGTKNHMRVSKIALISGEKVGYVLLPAMAFPQKCRAPTSARVRNPRNSNLTSQLTMESGSMVSQRKSRNVLLLSMPLL